MLDYEGITARDLKRIVNRGEATPAAIGLFVLYDYWEREHGRRSIVDNKLLRYIESKWAYSTYANELDFWLELGAELRIMELQGLQQGLRAQIALQDADTLVMRTLHWFMSDFYAQLIKQAEPLGVDLQEHIERLSKTGARPPNLPSDSEVEATAWAGRTHTANYLGYISILGAAGGVLGLALAEEMERSSGVDLSPWATEQNRVLADLPGVGEILEEFWPDKAKELKQLTAIGSVRPSPDAIMTVERILAAYLSPNWRTWARAGVNLRVIAEGSKGVSELIRHADLAAVELGHG